MVKIIKLTICILACLFALNVFGAEQGNNMDKVLSAAEGFFKQLQAKNYRQTWSCLSSKSKEVIVEEIYKGSNAQYSLEQVRSDLQAGGMIAAGYWKGVLQTFDPRTILENSKWETGRIGPKEAELVITYKKSSNPALIRMYNESGEWKLGLVESFWTRKDK